MKSIRSLLFTGVGCLLAWPTLVLADDIVLHNDQLRDAPPDVVALARREAGCQHWMNVEITDEESDDLVEHSLSRLRCDSLATDLTALRHKYAQSKPALKALDAARALGP